MFNPDDDHLRQLAVEENTLTTKLALCKRVEQWLNDSVWKDIVEPTIDKSIIDVLGGKIGNSWTNGLLDRARKDERREYYIGYKTALIDFHTRTLDYVRQIKVLESRIQGIAKERDIQPSIPLMEGEGYGE